jgi:hypothetical protein
MSKTLKSMMFEPELSQTIAASAPVEQMTITLHFEDVNRALEFWLNNVLLRHPVTVEYWNTTRDRNTLTVVVTPHAAGKKAP